MKPCCPVALFPPAAVARISSAQRAAKNASTTDVGALAPANDTNVSTTDRVRGRYMLARRTLPLLGPAVVFGVAWASTGVRTTMAIANVALVMAALTVAVATISWQAGLCTSVVAALTLNYFHTDPVHSLRITTASDLISVVLLAAIGIAVSLATAVRVRSLARAHVADAAAQGRSLLTTAGVDNRPVEAMWFEAVRSACAALSLVECRIEPLGASPRLAAIARQRPALDGPNGFVLPEAGAVVTFKDPRLAVQVVLTPKPGMGSLELDRRTVMAFVDQIELVLGEIDRGSSAA